MRALLLCLAVFLSLSVQKGSIDAIAAAIKRGDAQSVAVNFSPSVDMTVNGTEDIYSARQAQMILAEFFHNNAPKNVTVLHRLESNTSYHYAVLMLTTANGSFRIALSLKSSGSNFLISELRIEPEKSK